MSICKGTCKNGSACSYKAKEDGYCLIHKNIKKPEECIVCYSNLDKNSVKLECGHSFHKNCITKWLYKSMTCPMCRAEIKQQTLTELNIKIDKTLKVLEQAERQLFGEENEGCIVHRYMGCLALIIEVFQTELFLKRNIIVYLKKKVKQPKKYIDELTRNMHTIKSWGDQIVDIMPVTRINANIPNILETMIKNVLLLENM